jgi:signal transduction histidine kinase
MLPGPAAFTVSAMTSQDGRAATQARPAARERFGLDRITIPVSIAVLVAATVGIALELPGRSAGVIAGAAIALLVAVAGTVIVLQPRPISEGVAVAALVAVGLAGALLAAIGANSLAIAYLSLAALGLRLPARYALPAAGVVFAALNLSLALTSSVSVTDLLSLDTGAGFLFLIGAFTRSSLIAQRQAREAQARAEDLVGQLQAAQAARAEAAALTERARLAREIHDILAHALSGLVLALDTMELLGRQAGTDPRALDELLAQVRRSQRIARDGLADTKRAISALRGDELPGPALLEQLVRDTAAASSIRARLTVDGPQRPLPPEVGLALYRTAQEALTNTAKYSGQGASVELRLTYAQDAVELVAEDSRSEGSAPAASGLTFGGYGLTGMRERAELLGGSLTAGPTELGFGVRLRLPVSPQPTLACASNGPTP